MHVKVALKRGVLYLGSKLTWMVFSALTQRAQAYLLIMNHHHHDVASGILITIYPSTNRRRINYALLYGYSIVTAA